MLRITRRTRGEGETLVVEGRLVGPWIGELRAAVAAATRRSARVGLDLRGVRFAAPEGVALIRALVARGVRVLESSPFVSELLRR